MRFIETRLSGAYIIELEPLEDERGFFARTFCQEQFKKHGLKPTIAQCNVSYNRARGTLRGMHFQAAPCGETKLIRCLAGAIYDVIIDLRSDSPTYCKWIGIELGARQPRPTLYIPEHFAHGFQTLENDTEVFYQMSQFYHPEAARGVRWNDPAFGIKWPDIQPTVSERDRNFPDFGLTGGCKSGER
jgi:dTDP-4-dehydrorhamnose 3,5-epimerase